MPFIHIKTLEKRKSVCFACPKYNRTDNSCSIDGQGINLKVFIGNCLENRWPLEFYRETHTPSKKKPHEEPSFLTKAKTFAKSIYVWAAAGFLKSGKKQLAKRMEICAGCEFWDKKAWGGTGKCKKCGCSTWAKLRIRTEKCPIGKW